MSGVDALARMLPSLAVIVGALLLLRHWAQKGVRGGATTSLRVVSRTGIAKGSVVAIVEVGERRLLVGAADQGVSLLAELDDVGVAADQTSPRPSTTVQTPSTPATDPEGADELRQALTAALPTATTTDRPRMAPIDRLRHMTLRSPVTSHPSRPNRAHPRP